MADFTFEGKAKEVYDVLIESSPKPFRKMTEKKMCEGLEAKVGAGGTVTIDTLVEVTKEITPKPFVGMALKKIEPYMS